MSAMGQRLLLVTWKRSQRSNLVLCVDEMIGEHQYEILDFVAAKFHEELGVFKLLVTCQQLPVILALKDVALRDFLGLYSADV